MKTPHLPTEKVTRSWHLFDAKDQVLGRLATQIAKLLMGKHKVTYSPHLDCGDHVIVINSKLVRVTGKKEKEKLYRNHSGYPGGLKELTYFQVMERFPARIIQSAVSGMLPSNRLRQQRLKRLRVFPGSEHPYANKLGPTVKENQVKEKLPKSKNKK